MKRPTVSQIVMYIFCAALVGCAGWSRGCSSYDAEHFGADWVVAQMDFQGKPFRCWELRNAAITNEQGSDGIYWKDPQSGNLVHISNLYNRVQVVSDNWARAYAEIGLTKAECEEVHKLGYRAHLVDPNAKVTDDSANGAGLNFKNDIKRTMDDDPPPSPPTTMKLKRWSEDKQRLLEKNLGDVLPPKL